MYNPTGHASLVIATGGSPLPTRNLRIKRLRCYGRSCLPKGSSAEYSIPGPDPDTKAAGKVSERHKYRCDFED